MADLNLKIDKFYGGIILDDKSNIAGVASNVAVSNANSVVKLFLNKDNYGDHRLVGSGEFVEVNSVALDSFLRIKPDFIKMDIQGSEVLALQGGENIFNEAKNVILEYMPDLIEDSGQNPNDIFKLLSKFTVQIIDDGNLHFKK